MRRPNSTAGNLSLIDSNHGGRRAYLSVICLVLCSALMAGVPAVRADQAATGQAPIEALHVPELDAGFHLLYELKPEEARNQFEAWQKSHPEDPLGSASEAAAYLFEECYRQGVLTSEFFLNDKRFLGKIPLKPDPELRAAFFAADKKAQDLAQMQLKIEPGRPERTVRHDPKLGHAGGLRQPDRQAAARQPEKDPRSGYVCQETVG